MSFIGVMLALHTQLRKYWKFMHQFSGMLTVPLVLALIYMSSCRLTSYQKNNKKIKEKPRNSNISFRNKTTEDLNPIYTEQSIYDGIIPAFISFLLCLQGIGWYEMAFRMGWYWSGENLPPEVHHAEHAFLAQVICDIFIVCFLFAFTSSIARSFDTSKSSEDIVDVSL